MVRAFPCRPCIPLLSFVAISCSEHFDVHSQINIWKGYIIPFQNSWVLRWLVGLRDVMALMALWTEAWHVILCSLFRSLWSVVYHRPKDLRKSHATFQKPKKLKKSTHCVLVVFALLKLTFLDPSLSTKATLLQILRAHSWGTPRSGSYAVQAILDLPEPSFLEFIKQADPFFNLKYFFPFDIFNII